MFQQTIGSYNLIYAITPTGTPTLVQDLLTAPDLAELNALLTEAKNNRIVVDGYLFGSAAFSVSHKIGGASESVGSGLRYPLPVYNWHQYVYVAGSGTITVRFLLSRI